MSEYIVNWRIELDADSPEDAARAALFIQRNRESVAVVFDVTDEAGVTVTVDLDPDVEAHRTGS